MAYIKNIRWINQCGYDKTTVFNTGSSRLRGIGVHFAWPIAVLRA
jgi:hypothetical protein